MSLDIKELADLKKACNGFDAIYDALEAYENWFTSKDESSSGALSLIHQMVKALEDTLRSEIEGLAKPKQ